jgi:hypothetical protein
MRALSLCKQVVFGEIDSKTILDPRKDKLLMLNTIFYPFGMIFLLTVRFYYDSFSHRLHAFCLLIDVISSYVC